MLPIHKSDLVSEAIYLLLSISNKLFLDQTIRSETGLEGFEPNSERKLGDRNNPDT